MCLVPGEARLSRDGVMLPFLDSTAAERGRSTIALEVFLICPSKTLNHDDESA